MCKRILIVDDEPSIVRLLSSRLKAKNYDILKAYNGMECIEIALKEIPDLILMDIKIPNGDGIGTFEKLLQQKETRNIPVIFMSAYSRKEINVQLLKLGAKACITKPIVSPGFEKTIARALAN